jgi:hypothetical protein
MLAKLVKNGRSFNRAQTGCDVRHRSVDAKIANALIENLDYFREADLWRPTRESPQLLGGAESRPGAGTCGNEFKLDA